MYVAPALPPPSARDTKLSVGSIYDEGDDDEVTSILVPSAHPLRAVAQEPEPEAAPASAEAEEPKPGYRTLPSPLPNLAPQTSFSSPTAPPPQALYRRARALLQRWDLAWAKAWLRRLALPSKTKRYVLSRAGKMAIGAGIAALAAILLLIVLTPHTGNLVVTVAGPGSARLQGVSVYVDDVQRCNTSPCSLQGLTPGSHLVRAEAPGFEVTTERAVVVSAGQDVAYNFALLAKAPPKAGLEIAASSLPLRVFLDGSQLGTLPLSLNGLEPKDHLLRFEAGDRYESVEEHVTPAAGQTLHIDPPALGLKHARLTLTLSNDSHGASVSVDDRSFDAFPAVVDLDPLAPHQIKATLEGHKDFSREVRFDQSLEQTVDIDLPALVPPPAAPAPAKTTQEATAAQPVGTALLNLNSLPPATVFVNGQSVGLTPKLGVKVRAGKSLVLFVHPQKGRKQVVVTLAPNDTHTVSVRF